MDNDGPPYINSSSTWSPGDRFSNRIHSSSIIQGSRIQIFTDVSKIKNGCGLGVYTLKHPSGCSVFQANDKEKEDLKYLLC